MKFVAKTFHGLENILAKELLSLGAERVKKLRRAVEFRGNKELLYAANLGCSTAIAILQPLHQFRARNEQELYDGVREVEWTSIFSMNHTFAVFSSVNSEIFRHSKYAALKTKDAIVDQFRDKYGKRPNVDAVNPTVRINLRVHKNECNISLDTSGDALFKRGYRSEQGFAPLNEVLAAGLVRLSGWKGDTPFLDPMCGAGTIPIEAAFYASGKPVFTNRRRFGFQNWGDFEPELWKRVRTKLTEQDNSSRISIRAYDRAGKAVDMAKRNAEKAGVEGLIQFSRVPFHLSFPASDDTTVVFNPPYDQRLKLADSVDFYEGLLKRLKDAYGQCNNWILIPEDTVDRMHIKAERSIDLFNGNIPCNFIQIK